jgi:hypothetical protein
MKTAEKVDLDQARLDPGAVFRSPEALRDHPSLPLALRIELLRRWRYDLAELSVAEEEGMGGGESAALLQRVIDALSDLGDDSADGPQPPTKHNS